MVELRHPESIPRCTVEDAYALCEKVARNHYENFTVGSLFLPRGMKRHLYAVYAYCRLVDDLGDEYSGDRNEALSDIQDQLDECYDGSPTEPVMLALQDTVKKFDIPKSPFLGLIKANKIDQIKTRYQTYIELEDYCNYSANPVGHMVLHLFGYHDDAYQRLSDFTCTALQLANFWQDVARDYSMGRVYLPVEDMLRFGVDQNDIAVRRFSANFRNLMEFEVQRTRTLFSRGLALIDMVDGRLRLDLALYSLGGLKILDLIQAAGYDVLTMRPTLSKWAKFCLVTSTVMKLSILRRI